MCARSCRVSSISVCSPAGLQDTILSALVRRDAPMATYATPLGCNAVLLTAVTMVMDLDSEVEWKLLFCCFLICSLMKSEVPVTARGRAGRALVCLVCCSIGTVTSKQYYGDKSV